MEGAETTRRTQGDNPIGADARSAGTLGMSDRLGLLRPEEEWKR
jgi:hypothetical protein